MKKLLVSLFAIVALALAGVASAATPQGNLTGAGNVATSISISRAEANGTITDGETVYVGLNNDKSGDCVGDSGGINVNYSAASGFPNSSFTIQCAHYTATASGGWMSFSWYDSNLNTWVVFRIGDRGQNAGLDKFEYTTATTATNAMRAVNLGVAGCGFCTATLTHSTTSGGNWQLSA